MGGEAFVPSFGALGIGGLIAFVIGSIILIDTDTQNYNYSEAWNTIASSDIAPGQRVKVTDMDGLSLKVEQI